MLQGWTTRSWEFEGIMAKMSDPVGIIEKAVSAHDKRFDQFEE